MQAFKYTGPVSYYGKVVTNNWTAETHAESKAKAVNNLKYQFKNKMNLVSSAGGIELSGKITTM